MNLKALANLNAWPRIYKPEMASLVAGCDMACLQQAVPQ